MLKVSFSDESNCDLLTLNLEAKKQHIFENRKTFGHDKSAKRTTLARVEDALNRQSKQTFQDQTYPTPPKEESKASNPFKPAPDATESYVKRVSEHPRDRLNKFQKTPKSFHPRSLEAQKKNRIGRQFSVQNIKFVRPFWKELLGFDISPRISLLQYDPEDHTYKTKPAYIKTIREFIIKK